MREAIHRKGRRRTIPEDPSEPDLPGGGQHNGRYRSRTAPRERVPVRGSSPSHSPLREILDAARQRNVSSLRSAHARSSFSPRPIAALPREIFRPPSSRRGDRASSAEVRARPASNAAGSLLARIASHARPGWTPLRGARQGGGGRAEPAPGSRRHRDPSGSLSYEPLYRARYRVADR